jgi:hypothetical protein
VQVNQQLKLKALRFSTLPTSVQFAPKTIKLYVNQPSVDFDTSIEPAEELVLDEEQAKGLKAVELRFVRFQRLNHLSVRSVLPAHPIEKDIGLMQFVHRSSSSTTKEERTLRGSTSSS